MQQFLAKYKIVQLRQPPYSSDIALFGFWMFPKLKMALKGKRFDDIETIRVMRHASCRPFQNLRSRTALRCGSTAGSVWFNQMGTTSNDATARMTKNSTNADIWTQVGYFSDTPRIYKYIFLYIIKRSPSIHIYISLYYKKISRPCQELSGWGGGGAEAELF